jgi:hypothetical protein
VVALAVQTLACAEPRSNPSPAGKESTAGQAGAGAATPPSVTRCEEARMEKEVLKFRETSNPTLSDRQVGISNIYERDLADDSGIVAPRLSAVLVIHNSSSNDSRRQTVVVNSSVEIGADTYCVTAIEEGKNEPGSVSFRKVRP